MNPKQILLTLILLSTLLNATEHKGNVEYKQEGWQFLRPNSEDCHMVKRSKHVKAVCLSRAKVNWRFGNLVGEPLEKYSVMWSASSFIHLKNGDKIDLSNAGPLAARKAFKKLELSESSGFKVDVYGANSKHQIYINSGIGTYAKAGKFSSSMTGSPSWDKWFFNSNGITDICKAKDRNSKRNYNNAKSVKEIFSKKVFKIATLEPCNIRFNGIGAIDQALENDCSWRKGEAKKSCEEDCNRLKGKARKACKDKKKNDDKEMNALDSMFDGLEDENSALDSLDDLDGASTFSGLDDIEGGSDMCDPFADIEEVIASQDRAEKERETSTRTSDIRSKMRTSQGYCSNDKPIKPSSSFSCSIPHVNDNTPSGIVFYVTPPPPCERLRKKGWMTSYSNCMTKWNKQRPARERAEKRAKIEREIREREERNNRIEEYNEKIEIRNRQCQSEKSNWKYMKPNYTRLLKEWKSRRNTCILRVNKRYCEKIENVKIEEAQVDADLGLGSGVLRSLKKGKGSSIGVCEKTEKVKYERSIGESISPSGSNGGSGVRG